MVSRLRGDLDEPKRSREVVARLFRGYPRLAAFNRNSDGHPVATHVQSSCEVRQPGHEYRLAPKNADWIARPPARPGTSETVPRVAIVTQVESGLPIGRWAAMLPANADSVVVELERQQLGTRQRAPVQRDKPRFALCSERIYGVESVNGHR
jgi:hypothetical protein